MDKIKGLGKGTKIAILAAVIVVVACAAGAGIASALSAENQKNIEFYQDHIFDNTYVGGVDVSKLTAGEAAEKVNTAVRESSAAVADGDEIYDFTAADADVSEVPLSLFEEMVEEQDSNEWKSGCSEKTEKELPELEFDLGKLEAKVAAMDCVSGKDRKDAVDAQLKMDKGEFEIVPGQEGTRVDADALTDLVLQGTTNGAYDADRSEAGRAADRTAEVEAVSKAKQDYKELRASFVDEDKDGWDDNSDVIIADALAEAQQKIDDAEAALAKAKEEKRDVSGTYEGEKVKLEGISVGGDDAAAAREMKEIVASNYYEQPIWTGEEEEFQKAQEKARKWLGAEIDYTIDMIPHAEKVDSKVIQEFIVVNQDQIDVEFDEAAMAAWLHEIGEKYDTVGTTRHYVSPTGEEWDLSGGHFGWMTDEEAELPLLEDDIMNGRSTSRDFSYAQTAKGPKGDQEWGDFYVDVDRYDQTGRVVKDGEVIYSWRFVSGTNTPARETQIGFYDVFWKASPHVMKGEIDPRTGRPEYETPCQYFICFEKNGSAIHDATWRGDWSTTAWLRGNGSHGCLNSSYADAQWAYNNIDYGTPFIVHD